MNYTDEAGLRRLPGASSYLVLLLVLVRRPPAPSTVSRRQADAVLYTLYFIRQPPSSGRCTLYFILHTSAAVKRTLYFILYTS